MNPEFDDYFEAIGLPKSFQTRVEEVHSFYELACPERMVDVFVTDYLADEEGRKFENLWFLSTNFLGEAKRFASQDDVDLIPIPRIIRWHVTKTDYDMVNAVPTSRMTFDFTGENHITGDLRATQKNCDYLRDVVIKHFVPRTIPHE